MELTKLGSFGSTTGFSSHLHNPFFALMPPSTTETNGEVWGFSLVYTGSFQAEIEKGSQGLTRAMMGLHPDLLSWPLAPGETFTSPEAVAVYSDQGVGGLSRSYHRLYRNHLIRSDLSKQTRPTLLNSWEGLGFNYNQSTIYNLAVESAALGVKLFVLDDGWFGEQYPRVNDTGGLGGMSNLRFTCLTDNCSFWPASTACKRMTTDTNDRLGGQPSQVPFWLARTARAASNGSRRGQ